MRLLGVEDPTFPTLFAVSRDAMKHSYPEVEADYARISRVVIAEEEAFRRTLAAGTTILDTAVAAAKQSGEGSAVLSGEQAFALHDTYGFTIDLTLEMAAEQGVTVDEPARTRSRRRRDRPVPRRTARCSPACPSRSSSSATPSRSPGCGWRASW